MCLTIFPKFMMIAQCVMLFASGAEQGPNLIQGKPERRLIATAVRVIDGTPRVLLLYAQPLEPRIPYPNYEDSCNIAYFLVERACGSSEDNETLLWVRYLFQPDKDNSLLWRGAICAEAGEATYVVLGRHDGLLKLYVFAYKVEGVSLGEIPHSDAENVDNWPKPSADAVSRKELKVNFGPVHGIACLFNGDSLLLSVQQAEHCNYRLDLKTAGWCRLGCEQAADVR